MANTTRKGEKPSSFFRLARALGRKRCLSSLPCVAENSAVWNHPVCRLHPWPCHHIRQMLAGAESMQGLAQWGSALAGLFRTTINMIRNNNPHLSYWRYF